MNRKLPVFIPHENPTHTKTPTLSWHPHPDSSSGSCILKVNTDSSNLFNDKDHLFELPLGHPDDTSYTFTDDTLPTGTIYWKLEYDKSISSAIQSLTIVPDKKPIPIPFEVANRNRPSFSWKKTSDTESFTFELDDDMNFLSPIISTPVYSTFFVPYIDISGINKNYYWRVRSNKTRIWSETYKFKIDTVPLLHKFNGELHNDPRPTFQWDVAQSTSKYEYRIQIADNKRFKPNHIEKDIAAGSSFTPANNLPANKLLKKQKYFWRIGYSLQGQDNFTFTECDSITIDYTITAAGQLSGKQISPTHFFSSQKLISFSINNQKDRILGLYIYDLKGRNIHSVSLNNMDKNSIEWDYSLGNGRMVPSGMYLIKIISEKKIFNFKTLYCNQ
jgi:hypothetical protein